MTRNSNSNIVDQVSSQTREKTQNTRENSEFGTEKCKAVLFDADIDLKRAYQQTKAFGRIHLS